MQPLRGSRRAAFQDRAQTDRIQPDRTQAETATVGAGRRPTLSTRAELAQVRGQVEQVRVDAKGAVWARMRFSNTSPEEIHRVFLEEDPALFAPPASTFLRERTSEGGQTCLESPIGGPPIMRTTFTPKPAPEGETLIEVTGEGAMYGGGKIRCFRDGDETVVEEQGMIGYLDLRFVPVAGQFYGLCELAPVFGGYLRDARQWVEGAVGQKTGALHGHFVKRSVESLVRLLNDRRSRRIAANGEPGS